MCLIFRCFHSLDDVGDAERIQTAAGHRCRVRIIVLVLVLFFSFRAWIVDGLRMRCLSRGLYVRVIYDLIIAKQALKSSVLVPVLFFPF